MTALLLAGEQFAAPMREKESLRRRAPHASAAGDVAEPDTEFDWMVDVARHAAMRLAEKPERAELATVLSWGLGDGEALSTLFGGFFPALRPPLQLGDDGRPILTDRQVELLREAGQGLSHGEIADRLDISPRTVSTHLDRIYKRLGVHKPMQAVAQAVALGYLDLSAVGFVRGAANRGIRDFSTLHAFLSQIGDIEGLRGGQTFRRLAQFGLLLALAAAAATIPLQSDAAADTPMIGVVCRVSRDGSVLSAFGGDRLRMARGLCVAPPHAAHEGFRPDHLYVLNGALPQQGLNTAEVVEFSPAGEVLGSIAGACDVGLRLHDVQGITFDTRGRLLVTSGALTEAVLEFSKGGHRVRRFAGCPASQVAVSETGAAFVASTSPLGGRIAAYEAGGELCRVVCESAPGTGYTGIALNAKGNVLANKVHRGRGVIEEYTEFGEPVRLYTVSGVGRAQLAIDTRQRLYIPCPRSGDIKVFGPDGRVERRIPLDGIVTPYGVAIGPDDALWVSGQAE